MAIISKSHVASKATVDLKEPKKKIQIVSSMFTFISIKYCTLQKCLYHS